MIGPGSLLLITILPSVAALAGGLVVFLILRNYSKAEKDQIDRTREYTATLEGLLATTRKVNKIFAGEYTLDSILNNICKTLVEDRNYYSSWIILLEDGKPLLPCYHYGKSEGLLSLEETLKKGTLPSCIFEASQESGYYITRDPASHCPPCPLYQYYEGRAGFTTAIIHGETLLGYMGFSIPEAAVNNIEEQSLLFQLAEDIAYTVWVHKNDSKNKHIVRENSKLIDLVNDAVLSYDADKNIISFNRGAEELFQEKAETLLGNPIYGYLPESGNSEWVKLIEIIDEKGVLKNEKVQVVLQNGKKLDIEINAYNLKDKFNDRGQTSVFIKNVSGKIAREMEINRKIDLFMQPDIRIENLELTDLIDLKDLQQLQDDFAEATGVASVITDLKGNHITKPVNFCSFCEEIIGGTPEGNADCAKSERILGIFNPAGPNYNRCIPGNLRNAGTGIVVEGKQIASWYIGQVCDKKTREEEKKIIKYALKTGLDPEKVLKTYAEIPLMSSEDFEKAAIFLHTLSNQLSESACQSLLQSRAIYQRKEAFEKINKKEKYMESIFRAAPIGIGVVIDRVFINVNLFFCNIVGYSEEELLGNSSMMIYPDEATFEKAGRDKYRQIAEGGRGSVETRFMRKDGRIIDVILSSTPIDLEDLSRGFTFTAMDITYRKRNEEERKKLSLGIEQSREAFVITDSMGMIEYINPAFESITGYSAAEVLGKNPKILKSGEHNMEFYQNLWNTISTKQTWFGRMVNRKKDGSLYTEENTISPVLNEKGNIINYIAVKRDISRILKTEMEKNNLSEQYRQVQKVESIGRLAGGIAHDLNNLLSPILGYSEILEEEIPEDDPGHFKVQQILQAGIRAKDLVHQLLAFSRKQALLFERSSLNSILSKFKNFLTSTIRENIDIRIITKDNIPAIMADRGQIEQVIMNLSANSQDAMPNGGKLIIETDISDLDGDYATYHPGAKPGRYAVLSVSDTGTGMSKDIQDQIFEPFYSTKGESGTGLGLATVYGIIKQHRGNIWVYSEPDKGSTFKIYLPAADLKIENEKAVINKSRKSGIGGGEKILLAEDNNEVRQLCKTILESAGYFVIPATNGEHAMELVNSGKYKFDMLLTDVIMPGMNGKELYDNVKAVIPNLKILYMSGYTDNVIDIHFNFNEGRFFIQKPFSNRELLSKIKEVLSASS